MEQSSTLPILPTQTITVTAEAQQQEFAMVSTLLHILSDPTLFQAPGFEEPPPTHLSTEETIVAPSNNVNHKALKTLRALSFVLVRDHEIIALVSKVLPTGVVGFLSVTTPRWSWPSETQTIHVAQNSRAG